MGRASSASSPKPRFVPPPPSSNAASVIWKPAPATRSRGCRSTTRKHCGPPRNKPNERREQPHSHPHVVRHLFRSAEPRLEPFVIGGCHPHLEHQRIPFQRVIDHFAVLMEPRRARAVGGIAIGRTHV